MEVTTEKKIKFYNDDITHWEKYLSFLDKLGKDDYVARDIVNKLKTEVNKLKGYDKN